MFVDGGRVFLATTRTFDDSHVLAAKMEGGQGDGKRIYFMFAHF